MGLKNYKEILSNERMVKNIDQTMCIISVDKYTIICSTVFHSEWRVWSEGDVKFKRYFRTISSNKGVCKETFQTNKDWRIDAYSTYI